MDARQFESIFKTHFEGLCRFANRFLHDTDSSQEIVQDVFINLWQKRDTIDPEKQIRSYLFTSVKNRCLNHIRDNKKFRSYLLDVEIEMEIPVNDHDMLVAEELKRRIQEAFEKLPPKCRQVFELSRFEEMKYKEIAERLKISVKTVEVQISKALRILRDELGELLPLTLLFLGLQ